MREFLQTFTSLATFALVTLAAALLVTAVEVAAGALEVVLARLPLCDGHTHHTIIMSHVEYVGCNACYLIREPRVSLDGLFRNIGYSLNEREADALN